MFQESPDLELLCAFDCWHLPFQTPNGNRDGCSNFEMIYEMIYKLPNDRANRGLVSIIESDAFRCKS